jgi:hypothetical protein
MRDRATVLPQFDAIFDYAMISAHHDNAWSQRNASVTREAPLLKKMRISVSSG